MPIGIHLPNRHPYYPDKMGICLRTGTSANKCPSSLNYVCGANGASYTNECYALTSGTTVACKGKCPCQANTCLALWAPVCGSNGVTYGNACKAQQASATVACNRACPCKICPASPVALCNQGEKRTNSYDSNGCPVYRCEKTPCGPIAPVSCGPSERIISEKGTDGCTRYRCVAFEGTCKDRCGSFPWYAGKCRCDRSCLVRGDCCLDYNTHCTLKCPSTIETVCGSNGITYNNQCEAERAGTRIICKGQCPCNRVCPVYPTPYCPSGKLTLGEKMADGCIGPQKCVPKMCAIYPRPYCPIGKAIPGEKMADGCTGPPKCTTNTFGSCHDSCGSMSKTGTCQCDKQCESLNDCCVDYKTECA